MTPVIDTTGFPDGGNGVRRWSRAVSRATVPVTVASHGAPPAEGRMTTQPPGHLLFVATDADPQCFPQQGGRTAELTAGTLAPWDTERPHVAGFPRGVNIKACLVPRRALGVRDDEPERVTATVTEGDGPVAALVGPLPGDRGGSGGRTASGVARRGGFSSPARFGRLFHSAYGPASRWRDTRGGAGSSGPSAVVDGPLPTPAENDRVTSGAPCRRERRDRVSSVPKRSNTGGLTCGDEATHGGLVGIRGPRDSPHALMCLPTDGGLGLTVDLPSDDPLSDALAEPPGDETFPHRQATPKGGATGRRGPSPASAGQCGQEGA